MRGVILETHQALQNIMPESIQVPGYYLEMLDTPFWILFFRILTVLAVAVVIGGFVYLTTHSQEDKSVKGYPDNSDKEEE